MIQQRVEPIKMMIFAALFSALIAAGAFIAIPIGPVPIVLQNFFVFLAGLTLSWRWALASVLIYLLAGVLGLPVFSAGRGGLPHILGPTGGYLLGYIPSVMVIGILSDAAAKIRNRPFTRISIEVLILLLGSAVVYVIGVSWLKTQLKISWEKALAIGVLPFLVGDIVKIGVAIPLSRQLQKNFLSNHLRVKKTNESDSA